MSEKDLYRFLRGLLDVVFMGRRLYRKFGKRKSTNLSPPSIKREGTKLYLQRTSDVRCDRRIGPVDPGRINHDRQREVASNFGRGW